MFNIRLLASCLVEMRELEVFCASSSTFLMALAVSLLRALDTRGSFLDGEEGCSWDLSLTTTTASNIIRMKECTRGKIIYATSCIGRFVDA